MDENNGFQRFWAVVKKYAKRVWAYLKVAKMEYIVMISLFALDLISKAIVNATTAHGQVVVLIPNFLNIHNSHNYAAAFGNGWISDLLGSMGARIFFSIFAVGASVAFVIILIKNKGGNKLFRIALAMLTAGAMGNCIDRMFLGYVRDFVEFVYFGLTIAGSKSFYIFNIADAELVIGVILMIIYFLFMYRDKDDKKHADDDQEAETKADIENADGETVEGVETVGETSGSETEQPDAPRSDGDEGARAEKSDGEDSENTALAEQPENIEAASGEVESSEARDSDGGEKSQGEACGE